MRLTLMGFMGVCVGLLLVGDSSNAKSLDRTSSSDVVANFKLGETSQDVLNIQNDGSKRFPIVITYQKRTRSGAASPWNVVLCDFESYAEAFAFHSFVLRARSDSRLRFTKSPGTKATAKKSRRPIHLCGITH